MQQQTLPPELIFTLNSIAFQLRNDKEFKEAFSKNPSAVLEENGVTDIATKAFIMNELNSLLFMQQESGQKTSMLADRFKDSIKTSLEQIESGYRGSMWMYWIAFLTGILLIITAIVFGVMKKENLLSIVFGGLGTLDLLVFFIMKPPLELQNSRIGFARLEAAFMNWFLDMININSVLLLMGSVYKVAEIPPGVVITAETEKQRKDNFNEIYNKVVLLSDHALKNTEKTLQMMGTIIRQTAGEEEVHKKDTPKEEA